MTSKTRRNNTFGTSSVKIADDCPCTALAVISALSFFCFWSLASGLKITFKYTPHIHARITRIYNYIIYFASVVLTCRNVHDWLIFTAIRPSAYWMCCCIVFIFILYNIVIIIVAPGIMCEDEEIFQFQKARSDHNVLREHALRVYMTLYLYASL